MTGSTNVVQITNIAPQATKDQMQSLFGHLGKIEEIRLYPTIRDVSCPVHSRVCYVKYLENSSVQVAQHLTNTVFIDRALIVLPVQNGIIPDEYRALEMTNNGTSVPGLHGGDSKLPPEVVNRIDGVAPNQFVKTSDPKLDINNLPEYPNLPANLDARRIEEIRRTVCIYDLPSDMKLDDLMEHFASAGEIKYARWAEKNHAKYALIEFCEQKDIIEALKLHGTSVRGDTVSVYHSCDAISKPEAKSNEAAQREIEEAMSIVKEAQSMMSIDPVFGTLSKDKVAASSSSRRRSSRSRSRERSNRRSRSPSRRSRSRKRSKSRGRSRKSRSKSHRRSRSRSKRSASRPKRSRSRSHSKRSRSKERRSHSKRSRSKDRRVRRSRSRPRRSSRSRSRGSRSRRSHSRSVTRRRSKSRDRKKSRKTDKHRRSRTRSPSKRRSPSKAGHSSRTKEEKRSKKRSRSKESKHRSKKSLEEKVARDYDAEEKIGEEEKLAESGGSKRSDKSSPSPAKSDIMDISNSP